VLKRFSTAKNLSPVKMTVLEEQKPPNRSLQNFACQVQSVNFGENRLRGVGMARGQILAFSINLLCRHYNTLSHYRASV